MVINIVGQPDFQTSDIESQTSHCFSASQILMAKFIAEYYFCSLGEALNLFVPFSQEKGSLKFEEAEEKVSAITLSEKQTEALTVFKEASCLATVRRHRLGQDRDLHEVLRRDTC